MYLRPIFGVGAFGWWPAALRMLITCMYLLANRIKPVSYTVHVVDRGQ